MSEVREHHKGNRMKYGDLVKLDGWQVFSAGQKFPAKLCIFLRNISPEDDPHYSPAFPRCEVITNDGVFRVGLERLFKV